MELPIFLEPQYVELDPDTEKRDSSYTPGKRRQRKLYKIGLALFLKDKQRLGLIIYSPNYCGEDWKRADL
jgi:hypothetical protein